MGITSAYNPKENKWYRKWPESISQHDIVYLSPPDDPILGLPIGNGDVGALLWTEGSKLMLAVNKTDTWDDSPKEEFDNWAFDETENQTSLRHVCRMEVDFHMPVFDLLYQEDFEARVDLAGASAQFKSITPFSDVKITAYASHASKVIVLCCDVEMKEEVSPEVIVERWGSRVFKAYSRRIKRDATLGLSGTETSVANQTIMIRQQLRKINFAVGVKVMGEPYSVKRQHSRGGVFTFNASKKHRFYIYLAAATSENVEHPEAEVEALLKDAAESNERQVSDQHQLEWQDFWNKSFITLPENYIENIWYIVLYLANSSSRGASPPHFTHGLWGFTRDFVPWTFYFHWNMQTYIAPLYAANHSELAMPYHHYRYKQLNHAVYYANKYKHKKGAFYTDVSDRNGFNDLETADNLTPGSQIAMDFWKHYQYTGDQSFLTEMAWPVILEAARFYADCFVQGADGSYHIHDAQTYEGSPLFEDTVTDIAMAKALFPAALTAARLVGYLDEEIDRWQVIHEHIADFTLVDLQSDEIAQINGISSLTGGYGKDKHVTSFKVFAAGKYAREQGKPAMKVGDWIRKRYANRKDGYYGIPDPEFAPVFPANLVSLSDKASPLFQSSVNQVYMHPNTLIDETGHNQDCIDGDPCMGWCPFPIVAARLGLDEDIVSILKGTITKWQIYVQGFGHYGPFEDCMKEANDRWNRSIVTDVDTKEKVEFPTWPFRHFDNEAMPIVTTAVNEMLLQSFDELIRLFPATPKTWHAKFRLAAVNGFLVNTEYASGQVSWVCIESNLGRMCRIINPWEQSSIFCIELDPHGKVISTQELDGQSLQEDILLEFKTIGGNRYLLTQEKNSLIEWKIEPLVYEKNHNCKQLGEAGLGLPRMF